jgi:predicted nucleic acid-binding protein
MKIVLDSNIFISAFYWGGNPELTIIILKPKEYLDIINR